MQSDPVLSNANSSDGMQSDPVPPNTDNLHSSTAMQSDPVAPNADSLNSSTAVQSDPVPPNTDYLYSADDMQSDPVPNTTNQDSSDAVPRTVSVETPSFQQDYHFVLDEDLLRGRSLAHDVLDQLKGSRLPDDAMISVPVELLIRILNSGTCTHLLCHIPFILCSFYSVAVDL